MKFCIEAMAKKLQAAQQLDCKHQYIRQTEPSAFSFGLNLQLDTYAYGPRFCLPNDLNKAWQSCHALSSHLLHAQQTACG